MSYVVFGGVLKKPFDAGTYLKTVRRRKTDREPAGQRRIRAVHSALLWDFGG
jgi:hypothetical protein